MSLHAPVLRIMEMYVKALTPASEEYMKKFSASESDCHSAVTVPVYFESWKIQQTV
jgi:hypothetical protein